MNNKEIEIEVPTKKKRDKFTGKWKRQKDKQQDEKKERMCKSIPQTF